MTIDPTGMEIDDPAVHMLRSADVRGRENPGLSLDNATLLTGRNSGYQAINFAVHATPARIALLAYDMRFDGGKAHFHGDHPIKSHEPDFVGFAKRFRTMLPQLKTLGIEVLNCSPISLIDAFPKVSIEEALGA